LINDAASPMPGAALQTCLITVSASYGAGGSVVAPALAERMGVPFVDRVTGSAGQAPTPGHGESLCAEEAGSTPVHRLLGSLTHAMPAGPAVSPPSYRLGDDEIRHAAETEVLALAAAGRGVVLGRAAAAVLGRQRGFHVRLDGKPALRLAQGAMIEAVSLEEARAHMNAADKARTSYVRRLYGVDPADVFLYHLVIDSTVVPLSTVVDVVLLAATGTGTATSTGSAMSSRPSDAAAPVLY
jgi:cytidylate kinase